MATTTNFGWTTPNDTDLVKDGASAIRTLGSAIDISFVDLKGGTTGQVLSKATNTDLDYTWVTPQVGDITEVAAGTGISGGGTSGSVTITNSMATAIDAKGDLIAGTGADAFSRLAVGTNGQVLTADTTASTGLKWATPATTTSGMTLISRTTFSSVASVAVDSCFSSTYTSYLIVLEAVNNAAAQTDDLQMQWRTGTGTTYSSATYYSAVRSFDYTGALVSTATVAANQYTMLQNSWDSASYFVNGVGNTSETPRWHGTIIDYSSCIAAFGGGMLTASILATGFLIKPSGANNISGAISVYGLAK